MKNTIFFLEQVYDKDMIAKDDVLLNLSLNHDLFGTIKGYDEGKLTCSSEGLIFEYRNQPGVALKSSTIISIGTTPEDKLVVTTSNSIYVFRKTNL